MNDFYIAHPNRTNRQDANYTIRKLKTPDTLFILIGLNLFPG